MGKGPSTMEMTQQTLNREALFSDQSKYYQSPFEPHCGDRVTVTLRTAKDNVDEVYFISGRRQHPGDYLITTPIGPHL